MALPGLGVHELAQVTFKRAQGSSAGCCPPGGHREPLHMVPMVGLYAVSCAAQERVGMHLHCSLTSAAGVCYILCLAAGCRPFLPQAASMLELQELCAKSFNHYITPVSMSFYCISLCLAPAKSSQFLGLELKLGNICCGM